MAMIDRRQFLKRSALGLLIGGSVSSIGRAIQPSPEAVRRFVAETLVIDGVMQPRPMDGEWPKEPGAIKKLTGVDLAAMTLGEDSLDSVNRFLEHHSEVYLKVEKAEDIERARREGRHGVLYYFQNQFDFENDPERLNDWFSKGLRVFQPTYSEENELGGGSRADSVPLKPFGRAILTLCNQLGIVVDVSHCGRTTTLDVARFTKEPITANHVNAFALAAASRNKDLDELKAIADTGGVVGVTAINTILRPSEDKKATLENFVAQIDYLVENIGIDHIGIATDAYLDGHSQDKRHECAPPLNTQTRWFHLVQRLIDRNYSKASVEKLLGGNFRRVYEKVLPTGN